MPHESMNKGKNHMCQENWGFDVSTAVLDSVIMMVSIFVN